MALLAGARLGPYEILSPLGAGGMGEVYRALDRRLGREVAIKTLPDALLADPERRARFEQEARALAALSHPNIATLHEIEETEERPFLVMELVGGDTLADRLSTQGALPLAEALQVGAQLAEGLAAAHARGIVHRDLKPANVKITAEGRVKILDFGLAKTGMGEAGGGDASLSPTAAVGLTSSGVLLGTAGYMSPEQVRGDAVDRRADAWAFGCMLFELLSGERAFPGNTPWQVLASVMNDEPDWALLPEETPVAVCELVERCLEKEPADRLADLGEARRVLEEASGRAARASAEGAVTRASGGRGADGVRPRSGGSAGQAARTARGRSAAQRDEPSGEGLLARHRRLVALACSLALVLAAAAALWWWRAQAAVAGKAPSVAVMPFRDLAGGESGQLLGQGLAAAVSAQLVDVEGIRVFPASATLEAVAKGADSLSVAKSLGADLVLDGSVQKAGDQVRVTFSLLRAPEGTQVAGGSVTAPAGSLFAAQDELAGEVLAALDLTRPQGAADDGGLPRPDQQDRYLQALGLLQRYDRAASIDAAVAILEKLVKEAPQSPLVHAALGRAFLGRLMLTDETSWAALARSYCERARQLAPHRPEVEVTLAQLALRTGDAAKAIPLLRHALAVQPGNSEALLALAQAWDGVGDAARAEEAYKRLIALQPGYWAAYSKLGGFYYAHGRFADAARMFQRVTELTPDSARAFSNLGGVLQLAGDFDGALRALQRSVALEETAEGLENLGTVQFYAAQYGDAARSFERATHVAPASFEAWLNLGDALRWSADRRPEAAAAYRRAIAVAQQQLELNPSDDAMRSRLALALARSGDVGGAEQQLAQAHAAALSPQGLYVAALVATAGGRSQDALELLQRAVAAGYDRQLIARDPEFTTLHGMPAFSALLRGT